LVKAIESGSGSTSSVKKVNWDERKRSVIATPSDRGEIMLKINETPGPGVPGSGVVP